MLINVVYFISVTQKENGRDQSLPKYGRMVIITFVCLVISDVDVAIEFSSGKLKATYYKKEVTVEVRTLSLNLNNKHILFG